MRRLMLTAALLGGVALLPSSAYAAACGSVTTSSFDSVITTLQTNLPSGTRAERRYKRNLIRSTQSNINSSCAMAESLENSMGGVANVNMSNFFSAFSADLSQITGILNQVKTLVSNPNPTTAQINQANTLIAQAKSMSDQVKQMARQMAKQLAESLEVNL